MANLLSNTTIGGYQSIHTGNIGSYALTSLPSHNHDDRYFTETESDGRFQPLENQRLSTGNSPTFADLYTNGWFRNYNNYGLYNQTHGNHFYATSNNQWTIAANGSYPQIVFRSGGYEGTIRGFVYADTSNQIGFLNNAGDWSLRTNSSKDTQIFGTLTVGSSGSSDIYMTDTDETTRRIHTNSGRIGFLNSSNNWGAYCDNTGNWFSDHSMRAPIFYDSANTAYYVDPAGTSNIWRLYANDKYHYFGYSDNWDNGNLNGENSTITNVHFQGHPDFWIGAGNTKWYTSVASGHHDLLINTMQANGGNIRGITFTASTSGGSVYRLGRWFSHNTQVGSYLQVDGGIKVGGTTDNYNTPVAKLQVISSTSGSDVLAVDGVNGRLFTVTDDLSDSLFSVNTIAGLPVIEAFADNTVKIGKYGSNSITISNSRIAINSDSVDSNFPFYVGDRSTAGSRHSLTNPGMGFNLADSYAQLQLFGTSGAYIDFTTSSGQDSAGRIMWSGQFIFSGDVYFNNPLYTYTLYDRNDTGYYLDMNGTSRLGTVNANELRSYGNAYLGDGNGDEVHINDILRVGATDSGDAHFYFGEGGSAGSDYGSHWYWDSGYTFTWYTRNAGSDTALFNYVTNDTSYVNWSRNFNMQNREINYTSQLHFNGGTRFLNYNSNYLYFQTDSTSVGGILVRDGNSSARGYSGYFDGSGFGLLNSSGNWGIRLNPGNVGTELFYAGNIKLATLSEGTRIYGNLHLDDNYGYGIVGVYSSSRYQGIFAMGNSYKLSADGTSTGNLYGLAWSHPDAGGQTKGGLEHQLLVMNYGVTQTAIGTGIWTSGLITTTSHGTSANWKAAYDWGNHASAGYLTSYTETDTLASVTGRGATTGTLITLTKNDVALKAQENGTGTAWRGRLGTFNATADKSAFLGNYNSRAGVFGHNNALTAWDDLWVNTLGVNGQGNLYLSWNTYVKGNDSDTNYTLWHSGSLTNLNQLTNGPGYVTSSGSVNYATTAGSAPNGSNINQFYNVSAGVGNGLSFWNGSSAYKISMGVGSLYQYGPVSDYSIKMQMNDGDTGRGFTWGRESYAPIAALNSTSGDMQIAGSLRAAGHLFTSYNGNNILLKTADAGGDAGILVQNSSGSFKLQLYGNGTDYGFLNGNWAGWDIRKTIGGVMYMNNDNGYYLQTNSTSNFYNLNIQGNAVVHAGNIGSQSVSYASTAGSAPANGGNSSTVGGYSVSVGASANTIPTRNANGYLIPESWIQLNGIYGLYSPTNGAHLRPNDGSYGSWMMTGSRNGWQGIEFNSGTNGNVTMMIATDSRVVGFHNNSYGWQIRWDGGTLYIGKGVNGGTDATVLDSSNYSTWAQPIASAINTGNIGSQSVSYATTAGTANAVAWTNVSSRPTALSQFTNDLGNYGGFLTSITAHTHAISDVSGLQTALDGKQAAGSYLTTSGKAADSELLDGIDSAYFVRGNGVNTLGYRTTNHTNSNSAGGLSSGFYDGSGMSNMPTSDWYHLIVNAHYNSATNNQYEFQLATAFWDKSNFYVRSISPGDVGPWRTLIHNGNIGSQSVNYANSAGSATSATTATTATVASQLNKFGDIYGQDWNSYYIQDKFIAAAVYGHSGANRPVTTYDYGVALSYGEASGPVMQMYFPENSPNLGTIFRKAHYRTGWNGNWSTWKTIVEQEGNTCTIVGGNQTGMEIHANVGYNQDPLTYFLLRGQADTSWKALKIRLTGDAGGQDIEFRRIAENGTDARMFYVPRGANQVIFDYQFVQGSDSRLKDNIIPITNSLDKVKSLRGVEFDWNSGVNEGTHDVGLIAQDVEAVLPEAVTTQEDGYKNLAYTKVIPLLVEAMKEQQATIENLLNRIKALEDK